MIVVKSSGRNKLNQNGIYLPKVNSRTTRIRRKILTKLTIKTPELHHCLVSLLPTSSITHNNQHNLASVHLPPNLNKKLL